MPQQPWPHWKLVLLSAATALLSSLVIAAIKDGATLSRFLSWTFSTFLLIYPSLLATGRSGRSCPRR